MMKLLLATALITLQGCAMTVATSPVPGYSPLTVPANDTPQFRIDQQACIQAVDKAWGAAAQRDNVAVIQFRQCLVNKGYRLLS